MQSFGIRHLRENIGSYTAEAEAGTISVITRNGTPLTVNIPFDEILLKLGVHKALAVKLYQKNVLTLSKAAQLAETPIDQFVAILGAAGISVMDYDAEDLQRELDQF